VVWFRWHRGHVAAPYHTNPWIVYTIAGDRRAWMPRENLMPAPYPSTWPPLELGPNFDAWRREQEQYYD
jgi:hypothetical protein